MSEKAKYVPLGLPAQASAADLRGFSRLCEYLSGLGSDVVGSGLDHAACIRAAGIDDLYNQPVLDAAAHTLIDLVDQGWAVGLHKSGPRLLLPQGEGDRDAEKARVRRQEHVRRDEQLRKPSVRRFVVSMERPHQHGTDIISVFDLMRDGRDLADALESADAATAVIQPYVQVVDDSTCQLTGFRLHDIWRYFRHTWANAYQTVPGRSMPILIRDAATKHHAVIGLAAISSPVVQIAQRDSWMGWETASFLAAVEADPTDKIARWLAERIQTQIDEVYVGDLLRDGVLDPAGLGPGDASCVARLRADAERHRQKHYSNSISPVRTIEADAWVQRAETALFRSKRSAALAEALEIAGGLGRHLHGYEQPVDGLRAALQDPKARAQIGRVIRRARGERVGTVVADLTVCGAVAPYNALAAGKLVGALAVSPPVLAAYRAKYSRPSEIASAMAGRAIEREARLSFIGTTSLYGSGSSQYNRLFWPQDIMGGSTGKKMGFYELGRSRSFGTSHFSDETVSALVRLTRLHGSFVRVNSLFGEGVSPRLRKVRLGLAALGWPTNDLLRHGRERILYGVPLVENLRDFSLGVDKEPEYLIDPSVSDADARVAEWWLERWALRRAAQPAVQEAMRRHRLVRPVSHGARVPLPRDEEPMTLDELCHEPADV